MVYIDGKETDPKELDPSKHTFIGTFRGKMIEPNGGLIMCRCGEILHHQGQNLDHWQRGHFDVPQYQTIGAEKGKVI